MVEVVVVAIVVVAAVMVFVSGILKEQLVSSMKQCVALPCICIQNVDFIHDLNSIH